MSEASDTVETDEHIEQPTNEPNTSDTSANINDSTPILYNLNISPVARCVRIVCRLINLELELR